MDYQMFLANKRKSIEKVGFTPKNLNSMLKDFQKYCVIKSIESGRFALFHDCGLGKTFQQLETAKLICENENGKALILCPLAVSGQTIEQGEKFGIGVSRFGSEFKNYDIEIANYEQIDNVDESKYCCVLLDESSILKNADGKMRTAITEKFRDTKYKFCFTATPSPNDPMEICTHAEFLGVAKRDEILSMFFVHDGGETSKWRIKGHAEDDFWSWVSSWSIMISNPCDLGFDGTGYTLPKLKMHEHKIETDLREGAGIFNDVAISATNFNSELRETMEERMIKAAEVANGTCEQVIIWIKQDAEEELICKLVPDAVPVRGSMKPELKEKRLLGFAHNEFRVLVTTLNAAEGRSERDEKHICPLQLDTIERAIHLWSNEGDTVFTPFMGIGSEVYQAVKMHRKGIGIELKEAYFDVACRNVQAAKEMSGQMSFL